MMENETSDFRGLLYNPTLESEVVMLFCLLLPHLPDSFVIDQGDLKMFPDCFALRNGRKVGIEFELYASNFERHKHHQNKNLTRCNIIVCWNNDIPYTIKRDGKEFLEVKGHEIEIISLDKKAKSLGLIKYGERPGVDRKCEESFFKQLENIKLENYGLVKELYAQVKQNENFAIRWGGGKRWLTMGFMVKKWKVAPISVYGNGKVEIAYQGNKSIFPWFELPNETKAELYRIFKNPKLKPWHKIPLENRADLNNIYRALEVLAEDSKRFDSVVWHTKS
ncbi:MAG: hypothetical protein QXO75_01820 [Nitrososphaerota archaeon]